jgi:perosamine synthetase
LKKKLLQSASTVKAGSQTLVKWGNLKPVPNKKAGGVIPVCTPTLLGNEKKYVTDCLDTNWISSKGAYIERFELAFAKRCNVRHGISCSSGTAALHLALHAMGVGPGDEVIVPTFTIVATANAVTLTGAKPVFVDSEPASFTIDPQGVEAALTPQTRAILPTHIYGHPCAMDDILSWAKENELWVVEDAAEAFGASYRGQAVGSFGDAAVFSLYANKAITAGEGGMIVTDNDELAQLLRSLRDQAFSAETHFWHHYVGFNYRLTNMQAAIGLAQLENADELIERRIKNAQLYNERLKGIPGLVLPTTAPDAENVHWMYALLVTDEFRMDRDELMIILAKRGIETKTFFIPMHLQPIYYTPEYEGRFPVAEKIACQGMYLPSSGALTRSQIDYVTEAIRELGAQ